MSLNNNALTTVAKLLDSMGKSEADILISFFRIYNSADGTEATVAVSGNTLTLAITGGTYDGDSKAFDLTNASYDTITELVAAINAYGKGWVANAVYGGGSRDSSNLWNIPATSCLLAANEIDVMGKNYSYYEDLINKVSSKIEGICGRQFITTGADETQFYQSNNDQYIFLAKYPIVSFTSVDPWDEWNNESYGVYTENTDFIVNQQGALLYRGGGWGQRTKAVRVIGQFGYLPITNVATDIPEELQDACNKLCALRSENRGKTGVESEKMGTYTIKYGTEDIPSDVMDVLNDYMIRGSRQYVGSV